MQHTLIEMIARLYQHSDAETIAKFRINFLETKRFCEVGKKWNRIFQRWEYLIGETYAPTMAYSEEQIIGAIAGISQIKMHSNMVKYEITDMELIGV